MLVMRVQGVPLVGTGFILIGPMTGHRQPLSTSRKKKSLQLLWQLIVGPLLRLLWQLIAGPLSGGTSVSLFIPTILLLFPHWIRVLVGTMKSCDVFVDFSGYPPVTISTWLPITCRASRMLQPVAHPVSAPPGTLRPYGNLLITHLSICICRQKHCFFCLTDTLTGESITDSEVVSARRSLPVSLDEEVLHYRANSFSAATSKTYSAQRSAFLKILCSLED